MKNVLQTIIDLMVFRQVLKILVFHVNAIQLVQLEFVAVLEEVAHVKLVSLVKNVRNAHLVIVEKTARNVLAIQEEQCQVENVNCIVNAKLVLLMKFIWKNSKLLIFNRI